MFTCTAEWVNIRNLLQEHSIVHVEKLRQPARHSLPFSDLGGKNFTPRNAFFFDLPCNNDTRRPSREHVRECRHSIPLFFWFSYPRSPSRPHIQASLS